jgi:hypothetical protein
VQIYKKNQKKTKKPPKTKKNHWHGFFFLNPGFCQPCLQDIVAQVEDVDPVVELALPVRPGLDLLQLGQEFLAGAALHVLTERFGLVQDSSNICRSKLFICDRIRIPCLNWDIWTASFGTGFFQFVRYSRYQCCASGWGRIRIIFQMRPMGIGIQGIPIRIGINSKHLYPIFLIFP